MNKKLTFLTATLLLLIYFTPPVAVMGQTTDVIDNSATSSNLGGTATSTWASDFTLTGTSGAKYYIHSMGTKNTSNALQWNANGYLYMTGTSTDGAKLKSITITGTNSKSLDIFAQNSAYSASPTGTAVTTLNLTGSAVTYTFTSDYTYLAIKGKASSTSIVSISISWETASSTYTVTYNANGATTGTVPTDGNTYDATNNTVTVLGNTGDLAKTHYTFDGWNTKADGTGTSYTAGNTFTISANTTLYAKWNGNTNTVTLPATDTYGTYTMDATNPVAYGTTVELTYTPATGYDNYEATWSVNGTPISGNTFEMPDEAVTVTVSVAEVVDYATLPFTFNSGKSAIASTVGLTESGLGTDYSSDPKLKFDHTDDYLILKVNERIGTLTFKIKGNSFSGGTFKMQTSADGITYTDSKTYTSLGDTQTETIDNLAATVRYIKWIYTSKSNGNVALGNISATKYVVKYAITVTQPGAGGTIAADKAESEAGATITLTPTPDTHYNFTSWSVYKTGDPGTTVTVTDNQFTMPAYPVTVTATFTAMTVRTINIPAAIEDNVAVDATSNQAYAGDVVTITVIAPTGQLLLSLTVTGDSSSDPITLSPEVSSATDEYTFTMPDENVSIAATFGSNYTVQFSVNGTIDGTLEQTVTAGQSIATLPTSVTTPTGYTLAGWTADDSSTATILTGSYTPSANVTLFAVFAGSAVTKTYSFTISTSDFNSTSYAANNNEKTSTATATTGETMDVKWTSNQIMLQSSAMQWQSSNGYLYNSTDLGTITNVEITSTSGTFTTYYGTTAQPDLGDAGTDKGFFKTSVGSSLGKTSKMVITFQKSFTPNYTLIKDINSSETMSNVYGTYLVTVKDGGVLTLTGSNNGTTDNLIIEDGGQLVTSSAVSATVKKSIEAWTTDPVGGWYFIASPVNAALNPTAAGLITDNDNTNPTYDFYYLNGSENKWKNYRNATFSMSNGAGYLYANQSAQTLSFSGEIKPYSTSANTVTLANTGWNLIGNPFTCEVSVSTAFSELNNGTAVTNKDAGSRIMPCAGIAVYGTSGQTVTFTKAEAVSSAAPGQGGLNIAVVEQTANTRGVSAATDNAIVSFNEGSTLPKFNLLESSAKLYIPQGTEEYAIAYSEGQGEMPVNFKAANNGTYTLTVNPEGVEMDYLHLIDNMTGTEVDLLAEPSYTFEARTTDYESRFRLVFASSASEDANGDNAPFAFVSNGEIVVNGTGTLQVVDVLGRILRTQETSTANSQLSTANFKPGVYVLRIISGNDVRTQKIVVR